MLDIRLFWLALAAFVGAIEGGLIAGILPLISADLGVSLGQAGLLVLFYSLAYAIGPPLLALLLGGVGRRRILALSEAGLAVAALLMVLVQVFEWLVVVRTFLAVVAGTYTGTAMATAAMLAPEGQRGRYMQVISMGQAIASLAGVPLGALLAAKLGWRFEYMALAVMAAMAALALYTQLPRGMPGDTMSLGERLRVMRNPAIGTALLSTLAFMIGSAPLIVYVSAILDAVGVSYDALPLVFLSGGIGAIACSATAGRLADRFGSKQTAMISGWAVIVVMGAFAALVLVPAEFALPALMLTVGAQGFVVRTYSIAVASHMAQISPRAVPVAISLNMSAFMIGMALAAGVGGLVVDGWGAMALPIVGAPLVALALLILRRVPEGEPTAG
ncbi:MFS transporter [Devosia sp.]|jgi:predicted MFS family arabinose efflux permease|uniref:MFS transporter n=1 Tax=Devosia sp. TaxID=1871048 RepID=UPI0037BE3910